MSLEELLEIKGIGPSAIEKLKNFGIKNLATLKSQSQETLLNDVNLPKNVVDGILNFITNVDIKKDPKKKASIEKLTTKEIDAANEQFKLTRQYQHSYDEKTMGMIYKYNMFECSFCNHDIRIRRLAFWQEPETKKIYLRLTAVCKPSCMENIKSFRLEQITLDELEEENQSFLPE